MTELPPLDITDFPAYLNGVYGSNSNGEPRRPFPWQTRLLERVSTTGWPRLLDLPTGTGKSTAIDIALFHLALEATLEPAERRALTRIVLVVDRRTIVDQAHTQALRIQRRLAEADTPVLAAVRARLRSLSGEEAPLTVAHLRGGVLRDEAWARSPVQPVIAISTVDQVGSRLLFRGYGITDGMQPLHAGLLGMDSLFLLDEVHLSKPFRETVEGIMALSERTGDGIGRPMRVVLLSATPGTEEIPPEEIHSIADDDRKDEILRVRLRAEKPATCSEIAVKGEEKDRLDKVAGAIAARVKELRQTRPVAIGVIVNRVLTARSVHRALANELGSEGVFLLTGRMRPLDRSGLEGEVFQHVRAGRGPTERQIVVVATQSIEAGADFDFDHLITECASLDSIKQRFGRLNRLGNWQDSSGWIFVRSDAVGREDPVYGAALSNTWAQLQLLPELNFRLDRWSDPPEIERLLSKRKSAPVLLPTHLDAWVQTRPKPRPDPEAALWLHGPDPGLPEVRVIWRAAISTPSLLSCPPASSESMEVPLHAVRNWLRDRVAIDFADVEGEIADEARERGADSDLRVWTWKERKVEQASLREIGPNSIILVPPEIGGIANGNWDPSSTAPVSDLGDRANTEITGRVMIRMDRRVLTTHWHVTSEPPAWLTPPSPQEFAADRENLEEESSVEKWLRSVRGWDGEDAPPPWLRHYAALLLEDIAESGVEAIVTRLNEGTLTNQPPGDMGETSESYLVARSRRVRSRDELAPSTADRDTADSDFEATTDEDDGSFIGRDVYLRDHLRGVGDKARNFGEHLGLPTQLVRALSLAGAWHDAGKADPRFQRLLTGGDEFDALVRPEPLAKSNFAPGDWLQRRWARAQSGYPRGGRHEVTSLGLLHSSDLLSDLDPETVDLVLHLIATHHGYCRPLGPVVRDESPVDVELALDGHVMRCSSATGLESYDSGICDRFWRMVGRFGWHRLAWLEAILRLADHRRSEEEARGQ